MDNNLDKQNITFSEFFKILWLEKNLILILLSISLLISVGYIFFTPIKYESSVLLKTNETSSSSSMNSMFSQYSGLASIAGISLPNEGTSNSDYAIETILSREFLKHLLTFEGIRENLYAAKAYDELNQKILHNEKVFDVENNKWKNLKNSYPSYLEIYEEVIEDDLVIYQDKKTQFIEISFIHISPVFAQSFLNLIIKEFNNISKKIDLERAAHSLEYLQNQLILTNETEVRKSINELIQLQLNKQMIANVERDYMLTIIDPPFVPEKYKYPNKLMIVLIALMLGILSGATIALYKNLKKT